MAEITIRERERERERDGDQTRESTSGSNARTGNRSSLFGSTYSNEQTRETASMVADDDSRGKFGILDKQLLSGEAADTHTHGAEMLEWWMWMHRTTGERDERNPIHR